ncbi:hypothetical protein DY000_02022737 [Brassica cretica]|uniref:Uncharacterized protein n=1 Tax=Brassica cretica TaxID=69181 RepID=A0ABQ7E2R7_BRACR|nr:hypothetical protein DY000_02022737 [Brassica cretica]
MPSSTRSNKESQLLFSPDPASLEHSILKEARSSSFDNNTCSWLDFRQAPSTQALVPSTDTHSPPSTEDTHLPSTDIFHPTSIDTSVRTSIDTEPRDMFATLILVRDERGDLHDQEGHLRNPAGQRIDAQRNAIPEGNFNQSSQHQKPYSNNYTNMNTKFETLSTHVKKLEMQAVDTAYRDQRADELHEGFTYEELLNMQRSDETDQKRAEAAWERTCFSHPINRASRPSIDIYPSTSIDIDHTTSIDIRPIPKFTVSENAKFDKQYLTPDEFGIFRDLDGYTRAIDERTLHISREDIADILQTSNGVDNLFMQQQNIPEHHEKVTKEFYDTAGGIENRFKQKSRHPNRPSIDVDVPTLVDRRPEFGRRAFDFFGTRRFYWEEKDEYGIYRDD